MLITQWDCNDRIKRMLLDKKICISINETTDIGDCFVANLIVGIL